MKINILDKITSEVIVVNSIWDFPHVAGDLDEDHDRYIVTVVNYGDFSAKITLYPDLPEDIPFENFCKIYGI